ncbi:MAG: hypothetical protein PHU85_05185 [Phycisphaerae bacterium]|nr:hypothetical protein [Phycisphaerae bacterium]
MNGRAILIVLATCVSATVVYAQMPPMGGGMPPGHPPMGGSRPTSMPAGHPPMGMPGMGGMGSASQPDVKGSLIVRAVQGTKGGPVVVGEPVVVELYRMGQAVGKFNGKLDDRGMAVFDALPVGMGAQALVTVTHAGVPFRNVSPPMDEEHPDQSAKLTLYETTDTPPAWRITMRHIMVAPGDNDGVYVKEILVLDNPSDRVWTGQANKAGERSTMVFALPVDPVKFDIAESLAFDRHSAKFDGKTGQLTVVQPLLPGKSQYQFGYLLASTKGKLSLTVTAPQATSQLMVSMPKELAEACKVKGMTEMNAGPTQRMWSVSDLAVGAKFTFDFSKLGSIQRPPGKKSGSADDPSDEHDGPSTRTFVVWGAGLLAAGGVGYLLLKPSRQAPQRRA